MYIGFISHAVQTFEIISKIFFNIRSAYSLINLSSSIMLLRYCISIIVREHANLESSMLDAFVSSNLCIINKLI